MEFLELQENEHQKQDYYFAQISTDIRRIFSEDPKKIKIEDALLEFASPETKKKKPETQKQIDAKTKNHKNFFAVLLGIKP